MAAYRETEACQNLSNIYTHILHSHSINFSSTNRFNLTKAYRTNYSHGVAHTQEQVELNEKRMETWINPLEARLPLAPDMRIYCL